MRIRSQTDRIVLRGLARSRPDAPYMGEREDQIRLAWNRAMLMAREDIAGRLREQGYDVWSGAAEVLATKGRSDRQLWATASKGIEAE